MATSALEEAMERAKRAKQSPIVAKDTTGQLTAVRPKNLQERFDISGQPTPQLPLQAQVAGGTPDQTKMIGTATQKQSAQREQVQPNQQLATQQRQEQGRSTATGQEQQKLEKSANLQALGSVGDAVHNLISNEFTKITATQVQATPANGTQVDAKITNALNSGTPDQKKQAIVDYMNQFQENNGKAPTVADLQSLFPNDPAAAISTAAAAGLSDQLQADDNFAAALGMSDVQNLSQLQDKLGIQLPVGGTIQDFQKAISDAVQAEFGETERLKSLMYDPQASAQDRAAARQQLVDAGALGLSAAEQQAHNIEQSVSNADEVQFGGKSVKLEDLLNDHNFSGMVKSYYDNPQAAESIKKENPQLAQWLDSQKSNLEGIAKEVTGIGNDVQQTFNKNQELLKTASGALSPELAKLAIAGDTSKFGTEAIGYTKAGIGAYLNERKNNNDPAVASTLSAYNWIAQNTDPKVASVWAKVNPKGLEDLFVAGGPFDQYKDYLSNPNDPLLKIAFSGVKGPEDLSKATTKLTDLNVNKALGRVVNSTPDKKITALSPATKSLLEDGTLSPDEINQIPTMPSSLADLTNLKNLIPASNKNLQGPLDFKMESIKSDITTKAMQTNKISPTVEGVKAADVTKAISVLTNMLNEGTLDRYGKNLLAEYKDQNAKLEQIAKEKAKPVAAVKAPVTQSKLSKSVEDNTPHPITPGKTTLAQKVVEKAVPIVEKTTPKPLVNLAKKLKPKW